MAGQEPQSNTKQEDSAVDMPVKASFWATPSTRGSTLAVLAVIVWSFNFIAGRGLAGSVPPVTIATFRWLVAFCVILPFAVKSLRKDRSIILNHLPFFIMISLIGVSFFNTAIYFAAKTIPALNLSLIATSAPLFTIIMARIFYGEAISKRRALGILIVLTGVFMLLSKGELSVLTSLRFQFGDLIMLASAVSFSLYTLLVRKKPAGCSHISFLTVTFGLGLFFLLPFTFWELSVSELKPEFSLGVWGAFLYMGIGASLFSFACWSKAIADIGPAKASIIYYTMPFFCGIEAVLFLDESILPVHFISGVLILGGLIVATHEVKKTVPMNRKNKRKALSAIERR